MASFFSSLKEVFMTRLRASPLKKISSVIEQLTEIIEKRNEDDLWSFLSTQKGFRSEQFYADLSLLHYVAGREFETSEEADAWLSCALEQRNQDIENNSSGIGLRPLHCACEWGNIFGVEWLVSHGANVNVKSVAGRRTPFSYACASSIDTMKKMRYLEEHGCILSQSDIVWAAENKFSSSEKANEIFHYLVNVKELRVKTIETMVFKNTPLHRACSVGSIYGVKWLVEHNASINSVNKEGATPFMLACHSSIDRSLKVRYLGRNSADFGAKDSYLGRTALFYATRPLKCEDDAKDVLRYLVLEKGIDINFDNEKGMSPLLYACDKHPSFFIIQQLIELGAGVSARDKNQQNALHMAAKSHSIDKSVIDLLVEKGVDVTCQDRYGNTPYQVAHNGEMRALLRQHYDTARFSVLQQREVVRPDSIKVCVIGSEMAGKTTLVNSLLQLNEPPPKEDDRTPGVEIHYCTIPKVGKGSTWDFGAQPTFHSAHGLFFQQSNTLFCLVIPIRERKEMTSESVLRLLEKGRFWCAFSKAALRRLLPHLTSLIRLVVIFNLIGFHDEMRINVSIRLDEVVENLRKDFEDTFEISHVIKMDCSKSQSRCMDSCRKILKQIREEMLREADDVPKLCHAIEEYLSLPDDKRKKKPLAYFLTTDEFENWVANDVGIKLSEEEKKVAVEYLDSSGIIINLGRRICIRPLWLCRNVIGPLLASHNFVFGLPCENSGKASKKDMGSALRLFENYLTKKGTPSPFVVTVDEAIKVLIELDLCIQVKGMDGVYQINALSDEVPNDAWGEQSTMDVYRGQPFR
ncbi:death-associated protein kinase 1-like isoform X1 [Oscarella lobularis]|uniref:death-associated protein kinase 1-like isoform X1 n=1 Tax=Oscarella lobularis TaxID=121494 RepID=UPI0033141CE8